MNENEILASAYAKATASTRCAHMGECSNCTVRYCDYRSRYEAYLAGVGIRKPIVKMQLGLN